MTDNRYWKNHWFGGRQPLLSLSSVVFAERTVIAMHQALETGASAEVLADLLVMSGALKPRRSGNPAGARWRLYEVARSWAERYLRAPVDPKAFLRAADLMKAAYRAVGVSQMRPDMILMNQRDYEELQRELSRPAMIVPVGTHVSFDPSPEGYSVLRYAGPAPTFVPSARGAQLHQIQMLLAHNLISIEDAQRLLNAPEMPPQEWSRSPVLR